jgi:hypothetical protein
MADISFVRQPPVVFLKSVKIDEPVKSPISDGFVKSAEIKACESRGMRRT